MTIYERFEIEYPAYGPCLKYEKEQLYIFLQNTNRASLCKENRYGWTPAMYSAIYNPSWKDIKLPEWLEQDTEMRFTEKNIERDGKCVVIPNSIFLKEEDVIAMTLPRKYRELPGIPRGIEIIYEGYLDPDNSAVYASILNYLWSIGYRYYSTDMSGMGGDFSSTGMGLLLSHSKLIDNNSGEDEASCGYWKLKLSGKKNGEKASSAYYNFHAKHQEVMELLGIFSLFNHFKNRSEPINFLLAVSLMDD